MPLGNINETLLKIALDAIRGDVTKSAPVDRISFKSFKSSKDMSKFSNEMYIEPNMIPTKEIDKIILKTIY